MSLEMQSTDHLFDDAERLCLLASRDPQYLEEYKAAQARVATLEHAGWQRRNGTMTQEAQVLNHIKTAGSITVREAMIEYHIQSLTKRISNLREMGHDIISNRKTHSVTGAKYVRYSLASA